MNRLRLVVGIAVSIALGAFLVSTVDLRTLGEQLRRTEWSWTLVVAALAIVGLWVRARRWYYLFPPGSRPPALVPAMMIGYMVNNVLPLRAGEIVRVYVVARRWRRGFWTTLATLVVERVLDSLAIVLVLGVLVLLVPVPAMFRWAAATLVVVDVLAVTSLGMLAAAPARCRRFVERLTRRWPSLGARVLRVVERFAGGLDGVRTPAHALPLVAWSALVWIVPAMSAWLMLRAMHLELPLIVGWTVLAFVGLGVSIPSAPGYVGTFHYAAVLALEIFGVPRSTALGYAIVWHAAQLVPITLVGWLFALREHVRLGEATHARPAEEPGYPMA